MTLTAEERAKALWRRTWASPNMESVTKEIQEAVQQAKAELEPWLEHKPDCPCSGTWIETDKSYVFTGRAKEDKCTCGLAEKIKEVGE